MLIFENNFFLIGVVSWDSLDLSVWWNFKLILDIAVEEFSLLLQHLLYRDAHIVTQLFNERMFLSIFLHFFLDETECTIYDLLVELELSLLLI